MYADGGPLYAYVEDFFNNISRPKTIHSDILHYTAGYCINETHSSFKLYSHHILIVPISQA